RNYFRYDFSTTHGVPVMSMGRGAAPMFYANHPPTTPLLIAAIYKLIGYDGNYDRLPPDWPIRLPTTLFTVACIITIYMMVKNRASPRAGLIASALFATIPITLIYGGFADVISPQLLLFALLTIAAYERFHDAPNWKNFALLSLAFSAGAITDWPAFYLVPVLGIHFVITRRLRQWGWIIGFGLASVAIFAAIYSYLAIAQHDWYWMNWLVLRRTSSVSDAYSSFSLRDWFIRAIWQLAIGEHTLIVVALAILWIPLAVSRSFLHRADRLTALLLSWGILHALIGRQGVYQHQWWWWPMTPGIVIAAALSIESILSRLEQKQIVKSTTLNMGMFCLLILFTTFNAPAAVKELKHSEPMSPDDPKLDYSAAEIGQLIRNSAAPDQAVMLAESDMSLSLWYYADRGIKRWIWTPSKFIDRLDDGFVYLPYDSHQPWHGRCAAIIIPKAYIPHGLQPLVDYLDAHYPRHETETFIIYVLH
ncbi:MAG TPA: glycosyltransferase family 39 protein, partial [Tepidisphaeraceae bacterium]|nr:glycosyltransferase family 39 protein [Tepidisphaeraceae bacterium]